MIDIRKMIRLHLESIYIYQDFTERYMNNTDIERKDQSISKKKLKECFTPTC